MSRSRGISLAPEEGFVLVNDHEPKPLLYQFQAERPGRFNWSVLEAGPTRFRVEIRRRAGEGSRTVTELLEGDHDRLDGILDSVRTLVAAGSFGEARERFAEFTCGLRRHIDFEEQILFPVFEKATGMFEAGPTSVMRGEHVEIRDLLDAVAATLPDADSARAGDAIERLVDSLGTHNLKEERVLYPMADHAAGDDRARDDLVKRLQAF